MSRSTRRTFLKTSAVSAAAWMGAESMAADSKFRLKHSVVGWCFQNHGAKWDIETLCQKAKAAGCGSVEIVGPEDWPTLKKHGLTCAIAPSGTSGVFTRAWNTMRSYWSNPQPPLKNAVKRGWNA
jgi:hypothetical protein